MSDLINSLRKLASGGGDTEKTSEKCSKCLTVSERLRCCIVAFKVMKSNLDALNVDLQDFFVQLYNIILEYRPGRFVLNFSTLKFAVVTSYFNFCEENVVKQFLSQYLV